MELEIANNGTKEYYVLSPLLLRIDDKNGKASQKVAKETMASKKRVQKYTLLS